MDEWRTRLAEELLSAQDKATGDRPTAFGPPLISGPTAMEIAFGKARSELTYVLELGRAHHLPIVGNVVGDDIWIRLGETKLAFRFDRTASKIAGTVVGQDALLSWDPQSRAIVTRIGKPIDVEWFVRDAIDATVRAWKSPPQLMASNADKTIETHAIPAHDDPKE